MGVLSKSSPTSIERLEVSVAVPGIKEIKFLSEGNIHGTLRWLLCRLASTEEGPLLITSPTTIHNTVNVARINILIKTHIVGDWGNKPF